eukprot:12400464-Karenia_brevis.AAC.1
MTVTTAEVHDPSARPVEASRMGNGMFNPVNHSIDGLDLETLLGKAEDKGWLKSGKQAARREVTCKKLL